VSDEVWEYYPQEHREQIFLSHRGLWKGVLESQEPTLYNVAEQQGGPLAEYQGELPIRNVLTAPVLIEGGAAGFITMLNPREEYISRDLQLVMYLADIYSLALGRKETEQQLRYLATHDDLTNLPNRVYFNNTITQALAQVGTDVHLAVLLLDLNDFKQVNDTHGHKSGDQVLQQAAQRLRNSLRKSDTIARWGGDEFVIVVESDPAYRGPEVVVEKILGAFTDPIDLDHNQIPMTVSIGVSLYPQDGRDVESLIRHADEAMYHAKHNGYTHCFYSCIGDQTEQSNHPSFSKPVEGQVE
jgi:diguanylate cyclase (GGDEF)-like protein